MNRKKAIPRRTTLKHIGTASAVGLMGSQTAFAQPSSKHVSGTGSTVRKDIFNKVFATPFIDTHEHLIEEKGRFTGTEHPRVRSDDWSMLLSHYTDSDLLTAGMPQTDYDRFFSPGVDPKDKWRIIEPWWPAIRNTGYGLATEIAMRELYGVNELSGKTVKTVQTEYEKLRKPGFYNFILKNVSNIESCQVNSLEGTSFMETAMPQMLMQDISILGMFGSLNVDRMAKPAGIEVNALDDWYRVIDWWFETYGDYAVAVKSQHAYARNIDYEDVSREKVEKIFLKRLNGDDVSDNELKMLEDHLFWRSVRKATETDLPVKLHTGYYAGQNRMPLSRLIGNAGAATDICSINPESTFVFMHICYPYYEEILSVAKHYTNAHIDMCWSWIINPIAAKDFLKKYIMTAPSNKIVTFGGDYIPVEPVAGHAVVARHGIALAFAELVGEGWISTDRAMQLIDMVMHENARKLFRTDEKSRILSKAPWL